MNNLDELNRKLEIVEAASVQESEKPGTSGMSGDRPPRRAGRRPGRRGAKMDERAKLERSRLSARECRARKKLRYQYLEDLVANREKAIFALRDELELYKQWCIQVDEGLIPLALLKMVQEQSEKDPDLKKLLSDVVVVSDASDEVDDSVDDPLEEIEIDERFEEANQATCYTRASYNSEGMSDSGNTKNTSEVQKVYHASSGNDRTVHNAQSCLNQKIHTNNEVTGTHAVNTCQFDMSNASDSGRRPIKALSKQNSTQAETATELTRPHVHEAITCSDSTGATGSSSDLLIIPGERESNNVSASGPSRNFLVTPRERDNVTMWDLGALKFGSLDENLKSVEEDGDNFDLDEVTNLFQRKNRASGNKSQLPTIMEEN